MDQDTLQRLLIERWPVLFDRSPIAPLDLNIHRKIQTELALNEAGVASLVALLSVLTREPAYRQQIAAGGRRMRLDGKPGAPIRSWDKAAAKDALEGGDVHRKAFKQQSKARKQSKQASATTLPDPATEPTITQSVPSARPVLKLARRVAQS